MADASTTYWVKSGPRGITARTSPLILTSADDRFYEVYVGEVTRSYEDALFTREAIYRRDLLTGDSKLIYDDSRISRWEMAYLSQNPDARLVEPDEEGTDEISVAAMGEADILAVAGPYVLYDVRSTLEREDFQQADSARGAIDIRSGEPIPLASLVRDTAILGAGGVREKDGVKWSHAGYQVLSRWDEERGESSVSLRDRRGREWQLGYVDTRLPRIFWLDTPQVEVGLRNALGQAFEEARAEDVETHLVIRRHRLPAADYGRVASLTRAHSK